MNGTAHSYMAAKFGQLDAIYATKGEVFLMGEYFVQRTGTHKRISDDGCPKSECVCLSGYNSIW